MESEKSDIELMDKIRQGDMTAFGLLYARYADLIYRHILVRVNSSFDADDIFQSFFLNLWEKRDSIQINTLALTPDRNLAALMKRYRDGERDADFLKQYLPVLSSAYMQEEVKQVAGAYLDVLSVDEMATEENWALIKSYVRDPLSVPLKTVMAHRGKFYALAGQEAVDAKLTKSIVDAVDELMSWRADKKEPFDEERNAALADYLQGIDFPAAPAALAGLQSAACARAGDYRRMLDNMKAALDSNLFYTRDGVTYFQNCMRALQRSGDTLLIREGIRLTGIMRDHVTGLLDKGNITLSRKYLQQAIGDTEGARRSEEEHAALWEQWKAQNRAGE